MTNSFNETFDALNKLYEESQQDFTEAERKKLIDTLLKNKTDSLNLIIGYRKKVSEKIDSILYDAKTHGLGDGIMSYVKTYNNWAMTTYKFPSIIKLAAETAQLFLNKSRTKYTELVNQIVAILTPYKKQFNYSSGLLIGDYKNMKNNVHYLQQELNEKCKKFENDILAVYDTFLKALNYKEIRAK